MKTYVTAIIFLVQWGVVSAIGGMQDNGISSVYYFVSFAFFWLGLVMLISQTFKSVAARRSK